MDRRRAAGALLALAACIAGSAAAPTTGDHTALDLYGTEKSEGCYYNFQHYGEGDRIMTNEPCLNCTCHNRMLMCYLRVCPFTKAIGQDCTVEKRADQCCPIVTCPDVPVDLLTSTSTSSPAEYGGTAVGSLDNYGCSINGKYFPEGAKVPPTPNKPCEHCYCIRNMTTCVMQECTLHVDGCTPIYHKDVCCPVRYYCDHPDDQMPLLDDMTTTVPPTPGFYLTTTTEAPVTETQAKRECVEEDGKVYYDGARINKTDNPCVHCYCIKGDTVCVVQECGVPMENEGKNCTSLPPRRDQCCPDKYICEGDEQTTETTARTAYEELTTLQPPRRVSIEGSGYRLEPDEIQYIGKLTTESEVEGSGEESFTGKPTETSEILIPDKVPTEASIYEKLSTIADVLYSALTTQTPLLEEVEKQTTEPDKGQNTVPSDEEDSSKLSIIDQTTPKDELKTTIRNNQETFTTSGTEETTPRKDLSEDVTSKPDKIATIPEEISTKPEEITAKPEEITTKLEDITTKLEDITIKPIKTDSSDLFTKETTALTDKSPNTLVTEPTIETESSPNVDIKLTESPAEIDKESYESSTLHTNIQKDTITTTEATIASGDNTIPNASEEEQEPNKTKPTLTFETTTTDKQDSDSSSVTESGLDVPQTPEPTISSEQDIKEEDTYKKSTTEVSTSKEELDKKPLDASDKTTDTQITEEKTTPTYSETTISSEIMQKATTESTLFETTMMKEITSEEVFFTTEQVIEVVDETLASTDASANKESETPISTGLDISKGTTDTSMHTEANVETSSAPTELQSKLTTVADLKDKPEEPLQESSTESITDKTHPDKPQVESVTPIVEELITTETIDKLETTTVNLKDNEISESVSPIAQPGRIPGEGDCLHNSITYRNNSIIPSEDKCSSCKCVSSIVKCDPIICSILPEYLDNCQLVYDSIDACCPTYVCEHSKETIPPESHSQMSGTERPLPTPSIECKGGQCDINGDMQPPITTPEEESGTYPDTGSCEQGGCSTNVQEPSSEEKPELPTQCNGEKCPLPTESCTGENCQSSPAKEPEIIIDEVAPSCSGSDCKENLTPDAPKPCLGEECKTLPDSTPVKNIPVCESEDCTESKTPESTSCDNESCKVSNKDCTEGDCLTQGTLSPELEKNCTDGDCRRHEVDNLPEIGAEQSTLSSVTEPVLSTEVTSNAYIPEEIDSETINKNKPDHKEEEHKDATEEKGEKEEDHTESPESNVTLIDQQVTESVQIDTDKPHDEKLSTSVTDNTDRPLETVTKIPVFVEDKTESQSTEKTIETSTQIAEKNTKLPEYVTESKFYEESTEQITGMVSEIQDFTNAPISSVTDSLITETPKKPEEISTSSSVTESNIVTEIPVTVQESQFSDLPESHVVGVETETKVPGILTKDEEKVTENQETSDLANDVTTKPEDSISEDRSTIPSDLVTKLPDIQVTLPESHDQDVNVSELDDKSQIPEESPPVVTKLQVTTEALGELDMATLLTTVSDILSSSTDLPEAQKETEFSTSQETTSEQPVDNTVLSESITIHPMPTEQEPEKSPEITNVSEPEQSVTEVTDVFTTKSPDEHISPELDIKMTEAEHNLDVSTPPNISSVPQKQEEIAPHTEQNSDVLVDKEAEPVTSKVDVFIDKEPEPVTSQADLEPDTSPEIIIDKESSENVTPSNDSEKSTSSETLVEKETEFSRKDVDDHVTSPDFEKESEIPVTSKVNVEYITPSPDSSIVGDSDSPVTSETISDTSLSSTSSSLDKESEQPQTSIDRETSTEISVEKESDAPEIHQVQPGTTTEQESVTSVPPEVVEQHSTSPEMSIDKESELPLIPVIPEKLTTSSEMPVTKESESPSITDEGLEQQTTPAAISAEKETKLPQTPETSTEREFELPVITEVHSEQPSSSPVTSVEQESEAPVTPAIDIEEYGSSPSHSIDKESELPATRVTSVGQYVTSPEILEQSTKSPEKPTNEEPDLHGTSEINVEQFTESSPEKESDLSSTPSAELEFHTTAGENDVELPMSTSINVEQDLTSTEDTRQKGDVPTESPTVIFTTSEDSKIFEEHDKEHTNKPEFISQIPEITTSVHEVITEKNDLNIPGSETSKTSIEVQPTSPTQYSTQQEQLSEEPVTAQITVTSQDVDKATSAADKVPTPEQQEIKTEITLDTATVEPFVPTVLDSSEKVPSSEVEIDTEKSTLLPELVSPIVASSESPQFLPTDKYIETKITDDGPLSTSLCENKEDCKNIQIPVIPDSLCTEKSCTDIKVECSSGDCLGTSNIPSKEPEYVAECKEDECKKKDISKVEQDVQSIGVDGVETTKPTVAEESHTETSHFTLTKELMTTEAPLKTNSEGVPIDKVELPTEIITIQEQHTESPNEETPELVTKASEAPVMGIVPTEPSKYDVTNIKTETETEISETITSKLELTTNKYDETPKQPDVVTEAIEQQEEMTPKPPTKTTAFNEIEKETYTTEPALSQTSEEIKEETQRPDTLVTKPQLFVTETPAVNDELETTYPKKETTVSEAIEIKTEKPSDNILPTKEETQTEPDGQKEITTVPEITTTKEVTQETTEINVIGDIEKEKQTETPALLTTETIEVSTREPSDKYEEDEVTKGPEPSTSFSSNAPVSSESPIKIDSPEDKEKASERPQELETTSESKQDTSETTPYLVLLEEHTHKVDEETSTLSSSSSEEPIVVSVEDNETKEPQETVKPIDNEDSISVTEKDEIKPEISQTTVMITEELPQQSTEPTYTVEEVPAESTPILPESQDVENKNQEMEPTTSEQPIKIETPAVPEISDSVKPSLQTEDVTLQPEKDTYSTTTTKPAETNISFDTTAPEEEFLAVTQKVTTVKIEEEATTTKTEEEPITQPPQTFTQPEQTPSEVPPPSSPEVPKPSFGDIQPTDEIPSPEDEGQFPPSSGYGQEPDYVEEDQAFGPGTCRYGGKVYVSAQQIPRDDPCDFCFCFRSDIICLQQSCPPPIHGCHEEPIQGFCCPRYECPVSMATTLNVTTTTTTTTTTLPPHFLPHAYKGAAQRRGCQIKGHTYKVGEVVRASSGPCLHCTCGGDGQMKCDPKVCTPEPMLRQMIAAAVSAKRRR